MALPTDAELLAAARTDASAFRAFYERYAERVHGYHVRRTREPEAAHDLTAETFAQAWLSRRRFRDHVMAERLTFAASLSSERAEHFATTKVEGIMDASVGIVVTYDSTRGAPDVLGRHAIADAGLYSTCLAIQNLWLGATAIGYGVGWVSFYREAFLRHLVGIPAHVRPVAWLCLGPVSHLPDVPDLERHQWRVRRPVETAIHHERW